MDRREALQRLGMSALSLALPSTLLELSGCAGTKGGQSLTGPVQSPFDRLSPVNRWKGSSRAFSGDGSYERFHQALWNKNAVLSQKKIESHVERANLVVVGGGMSGIFSAYLLRDLNPILLEKSERFGGNSQAESWEGVEYSLGPSHFSKPTPGSPLDQMFSSAGAYSLCRVRNSVDPVLLNQKVYTDIWAGQSDPEAAKQFTRVRDFFLSYANGKIPFPKLPAEGEKDIPLLSELDRQDFLSFLIKNIGEPLHPHVHTLLELFCWSALGASMQELSAAVALSHYVSEFETVLVPQAGNASIAELFLRLFVNQVGRENARPNCIVVDVKASPDFVSVRYIDRLGTLREIQAKAVIMACPKFLVSRMIDGYTKNREEALKRLEYRAYVLGNACLNRAPTRDLQDLNLLQGGEMPFGETKRNQQNHGSAKVLFANYAQVQKPRSVLTICRPLPFDGGRLELQKPDSFGIHHEILKKELFETILPPLGYYNNDLVELRLARWGHAIPVAKPGFYFSNSPEILSKPMHDRIFFVNQDNWASPALETCALEALKWTPLVRAAIY